MTTGLKSIRAQNPNRARILAKIKDLAVEPRPDGVVKLSGLNAYRLRVGDYRIVYTIEDSIRIVSIIRISHRSNVYQDSDRRALHDPRRQATC